MAATAPVPMQAPAVVDRRRAGTGRLSLVQRTRLISAATGAVAEKGIGSVTIGDIVARSGASRRTFYEHFGDLDSCLSVVFDDAFAQASNDVTTAYGALGSWPERVRGAVAALLRFLESEPAAGRLLIVESLGAGAAVLDLRRRTLAVIAAELDVAGASARPRAELPPLVGEGITSGVLGVLHARLLAPEAGSLLQLTGPLTAMVLLPYMGSGAARRELARPAPEAPEPSATAYGDMLSGLGMRITYRTVRVLTALAERPGASNRQLATVAGISDQGQMSKLLNRFERLGVVANQAERLKGVPNAWRLTERGETIYAAIEGHLEVE